MSGKKIGYVRVSTQHQNNERQMAIMTDYQTNKDFIEYISGKDKNRPQLQGLLDYVREGDTVYVESYSRLARNTKDLLDIVSQLTEKGVTLVSNKEQADTSTTQGKLMLTIFGALAEFERDCLLDRQREGIEIAKAQGKYKGRPEKNIPEFFEYYISWRNKQLTATSICKKLEISRSSFYRKVNKMKNQWNVVRDAEEKPRIRTNDTYS